jgi:amino acid transporter
MSLHNKHLRSVFLIFYTLNGVIAILDFGVLLYHQQTEPETLYFSLRNLAIVLAYLICCLTGWIFLRHFNRIEPEGGISNSQIIDSPLPREEEHKPSAKWKKRTGRAAIICSIILIFYTYSVISAPSRFLTSTRIGVYLFFFLLFLFYILNAICIWNNLAADKKNDIEDDDDESTELPAPPEEKPTITFKWK